eukprot:5186717-Pyramimonas_sp.AAC.1
MGKSSGAEGCTSWGARTDGNWNGGAVTHARRCQAHAVAVRPPVGTVQNFVRDEPKVSHQHYINVIIRKYLRQQICVTV